MKFAYLESNHPNDPVKQTVSQVLPLKRPKQAYEDKLVQHLASHEPKELASLIASHSLAKWQSF